jgi:hypothetical protein
MPIDGVDPSNARSIVRLLAQAFGEIRCVPLPTIGAAICGQANMRGWDREQTENVILYAAKDVAELQGIMLDEVDLLQAAITFGYCDALNLRHPRAPDLRLVLNSADSV